MGPYIATDSCARQQLKRATNLDKLQPMVANSKTDFSERLNKACDEADPPIVTGRGRREELRRRLEHQQGLKLSGESVRKWLSAESVPSMDNARRLAALLKINVDWLLTGRLPMRPEQKQPDHSANEPDPDYSNPVTRQVIEIMKLLDDGERYQILGLAKHLLQQRTDQPDTFIKATGT
jgi:hypothetical protein